MTLRRYMPLLALLSAFLVLSQASSRVVFAWFCEGRICGMTPIFCCCTSPDGETRDTKCADTQQAETGPQTTLCPSGCECEMAAIGSAEKSPVTVTAALRLQAPPFALLSAAFRLTAPVAVFAPEIPQTGDVRGPPASPTYFSAHPLRAPPRS